MECNLSGPSIRRGASVFFLLALVFGRGVRGYHYGICHFNDEDDS